MGQAPSVEYCIGNSIGIVITLRHDERLVIYKEKLVSCVLKYPHESRADVLLTSF